MFTELFTFSECLQISMYISKYFDLMLKRNINYISWWVNIIVEKKKPNTMADLITQISVEIRAIQLVK